MRPAILACCLAASAGLTAQQPTSTFKTGVDLVPVDVSVVDLTFETDKPITKESILAAMKAAAEGPMKGILAYTEEQLVSSDYIGDPASSTFDATVTQVMGDNFAKIMSWYDNEWGFSNRMIELSQLVAGKL